MIKKEKVLAWLQIARLQVYPMTFIAYSLGAAIAYSSRFFNLEIFIFGYVVLFLIELGTVLSNEYFDYSGDSVNKNASIFNGGSRVLVDEKLSFTEVREALKLIFILIFISGSILIYIAKNNSIISLILLIFLGIFLGLGYTIPPLKFCYRGLGEIVVGITHSFYVIFCGYFFQVGLLNSTLPFLSAIPLFFAVLGAIILASIPDFEADKSVTKKTITVIFMPRIAAILSIIFILLAMVSGILFWKLNMLNFSTGKLMLLTIPHALILFAVIVRFIKIGNFDRKINSIMQLALSYIMWFGIVPLIYFLNAVK